jgi:hypothetical protein
MPALQRTARVICTLGVETATLAVLLLLGRRPELEVPVGHLGRWLREGDAATVVVALLRWVALLGAGWLLVSTLLYLAAAVSRVPAMVRAVAWSTLPAARRAIDAACAVSVVTGMVNGAVFVPATASAARSGGDATSVTVVRDGRGGRGEIAQLPPDTTTTTSTTTTTDPAPSAPLPPPPPTRDDVVVLDGDNLWELAARHLAVTSARTRTEVSDAEVAPYWGAVCDANRDRLSSGDVNLVFPGERVILPPPA